jgi:putative oxidoreductase
LTTGAVAALLVRCGLVLLFLPFSAADKLFGFANARSQAEEVFPRTLATLAIVIGLGIEIVCTAAVVAGLADRAAALVLAGYCAVTALLFKRFWAPGDFWSAPGGKGRTLFWDFLKNLSLGAGFLLIVVGPDGSGLDPFLRAPLASSHPYASQPGASHE